MEAWRASGGLEVWPLPTNLGVLRREGRVLLLGSADPEELSLIGVLPQEVDWVLLTHHYRDVARGVPELSSFGARLAVPQGERDLFEDPQSFWAGRAYLYHA
ncbi:MAG TPA: MBL fold metallo-hydrolase, partial [Armatimonadota bacterium]